MTRRLAKCVPMYLVQVGENSALRIYQQGIVSALKFLSSATKRTQKTTLNIGKPVSFISVFKTQMLKAWLKRLSLLVVKSE